MLCHVRVYVHGHDEAWPSEYRSTPLRLDSRFRGNDRVRGVQRGFASLPSV
jgi:hypothetical protein